MLLIKKYRFDHNKCTNWFGASIYFHAHARQNAKSMNIYALYKPWYHWYVTLFRNGNCNLIITEICAVIEKHKLKQQKKTMLK